MMQAIQVRFAIWFLIVVIVTAITYRILRWVLGTLDDGRGTFALIPGFAFAAFVSMAIANLAIDHGFRLPETGQAFSEAVQNVRTGWHWVQSLRS